MGILAQNRLGAMVALVFCVLLLGGANWPQWRGPGGQGISTESPLPSTWNANSANLKWKSAIQGEGISSPVVYNGRIYLTTAYEGTIRTTGEKIVTVISIGLAALFMLTLSLVWWNRRARKANAGDDGSQTFLVTSDRWFTAVATVAFLVAYVVCSFDLNAAAHMRRLADLPVVSRTVSPQWAPAEYFEATPGRPWAIWLVSSGVAFLGCALALGYLRCTRHSYRLCAAIFTAVGAALFFCAPRNLEQATIPVGWRLYPLAPGLLVGVWFLLSHWWLRPTSTHERSWHIVLLLCCMSALLFTAANSWAPEAGQLRVVVCLDFKDGRTIWQSPIISAADERKHDVNSFATPTPCTDGKYIFADFGCATTCLDLDGQVIWTSVNDHYYERREYGSGASPVMTNELLIVVRSAELWRDGQGPRRALGPSSIVAFEKETGRIKWLQESKQELTATYATPLLWVRGEKPELIVLGNDLVSYDPETGERLWSYQLDMEQPVPSLLAEGDNLYICGGLHNNKVVALRLSGSGKGAQVEMLWEKRRAAPDISSPVLVGGRIYTVNSNGVAKCFSAATGEVVWQKRITKEAKFFPSLVAGDGKVYIIDNSGRTMVLEEGNQFKVLAENILKDGQSRASPALANGCILIRIGGSLYCISA